MTLPMKPFADVVEDVSRGNPKLPQSAFADTGAIPIVDQGQKLIAGYTDDELLLCQVPGPVIVFGDHTRAFKYVDFPFVIGADGVKVLRVREGWEPKYVYHYLRAREVPSAGYSRHFKFLKTMEIPAPDIDEQRRVVALLDRAEVIRARRGEVLAGFDALIQSIFRDMFGARPFPLVSAGELMPSMRNGLSPATAGEFPADVLTLSAVTHGAFDPTAVKPGRFSVDPPDDKRVSASDFLMCRGNGNKTLVGAGVFSRADRPDLVFPDTVIAGRVDAGKVVLPFLDTAWRQSGVRRQIEAAARTTNGTYKVNQQTLSSVLVPLPPLPLQREFAARVECAGDARAVANRSLAVEAELLASIQARSFRGES